MLRIASGHAWKSPASLPGLQRSLTMASRSSSGIISHPPAALSCVNYRTSNAASSSGLAGQKAFKQHHVSSIANASFVSLAVFGSIVDAGALTTVADFGLNASIPVHAYLGMKNVVNDYVPPAAQSMSRWAVLAGLFVAGMGLFQLNMQGAGITGTVKSLWVRPKKKEE